jgi:chromosomal replication initiation ATPase DnaA
MGLMLADRRQMTLMFSSGGDAEQPFHVSGSNARAVAWLTTAWPNGRLAIWGPQAAGKSHLLRFWAKRRNAIILNGLTLDHYFTMPASGALGIDDADLVAPEHLLLSILNIAQERRLDVLMTSRSPPARWLTQSPDLRSRLRAITTAEIALPDAPLRASVFAELVETKVLSIAPMDVPAIAEKLPHSLQSVRKLAMVLERLPRDRRGQISRAVLERVAGAIRHEDIMAEATAGADGVDDRLMAPEFSA